MPGWSQRLSASRYFVAACTNSDSLSSSLPSRKRSIAACWFVGDTPRAHGRSCDVAGRSDFISCCARAGSASETTSATRSVLMMRPLVLLQVVDDWAAELPFEPLDAILLAL